MPQLAPVIGRQFFDDNGDPLTGGKLYSYLAGTSTPVETYQDEAGTLNTNPIILDSAGRCNLWISDSTSYKFILHDQFDVPISQDDDVTVATGGGGSDPGGWATHAITDGQAATDLEGETLDLSDYSSATYEVEIIRGTTVISNGTIRVQDLNGTGRVMIGEFNSTTSHGVTFTVSQAGTVVQLKAAASSGPGNGTVKLSRRVVPASP